MYSVSRLLSVVLLILAVNAAQAQQAATRKIVVSENKRFLQYEDGTPFFWLGDTGWLLFNKLTREEAQQYLQNRSAKGFNVIQCMLIPSLPLANVYGDSAFIGSDPSKPLVTSGSNPLHPGEYDYWTTLSLSSTRRGRGDCMLDSSPSGGPLQSSRRLLLRR